MSTPIILYDNLLNVSGASLFASRGYDADYLKDYKTYTFWADDSGGAVGSWVNFTLTLPSPMEADCFALAGHNFDTSVNGIELYHTSIRGENICYSILVPPGPGSFMGKFGLISSSRWILRIRRRVADIIPLLAVWFLGKRLDFPYMPDAPFSPYVEKVESVSNIARKGHILDTILDHKRYEIDITFSHFTDSWMESHYKPFMKYALSMKPFFYSHNLDSASPIFRKVYYVKLKDDFAFSFSMRMARRIESFSLGMEGYIE